jgi:adenylate cyclase
MNKGLTDMVSEYMQEYYWIVLLALAVWYMFYLRQGQRGMIKKHIHEKINTLFAGRISPANLKRLHDDPGLLNLEGERREITILYLEPRMTAAVYESLTPEEWSGYLNPYLSLVTGIVHETDGVILKYDGTSVTAFWGAPFDSDHAAYNACMAALMIRERIAQLNNDFESRNLPPIQPLFAIITEELFVGDYGSDQLPLYSLLGDYLYILKSIINQNYEMDTCILVTEKTRQTASDAFALEKLKEGIRKKGFYEVIPIYALTEKLDLAHN